MRWGSMSEEGSCEEDELELVKAFLCDPDSDHSDSDEAFNIQASCGSYKELQDGLCLHNEASSKAAKDGWGLGSATSRANSSSLLHLTARLEAPSPGESGSPHSQGHSSLTTFQSIGSEPGALGDDQSTFHSVMSLASSSSIFDIESLEDCSDKKRKASWPVAGHSEKRSSPAESVGSAVVEASPTPPPVLDPLSPAKLCCGDVTVGQCLTPLSAAPGPFAGASISTGVPVDTLAAPTPTPSPLPFARSPPPAAAYSVAWPAYQSPLPAKGAGVAPTAWRPAQAMIPTAPPAVPHFPAPARTAVPAAQPAPGTSVMSTQKIAAALAEMSKAPVGAGPLGLKLDKVGVTKMLRGMGMNRLAEF